MSHPAPSPEDHAAPGASGSSATGDKASTGDLVSRLSSEISTLVHDELRHAQVEITGKAKQVGVGAGMFGVSGVLALYAGGVLIAAAILALTLVLDAWLAAVIVGAVLVAAAGVAALLGRSRVTEAGAPVPTRAVESVKADVDAVRHARDH